MARKKLVTNAKKGAVVVKQSSELAAPEFMKGHAGRGTENIGMDDVETPRIILVQALSDQAKEGEVDAGNFVHSITETDFGDSLKIIPIFATQQFILWRPRHEGGGILARARDGVHWSPPDGEWTVKPFKDNKKTVIWKTAPTVRESGLAEWGSTDPDDSDSPPAATRIYTILCTLPDYPELGPVVVALQRSQIKVARKFLGKLKLSNVPSYGMIFNMSSFDDKNSAGDDFKNYRFQAAGFVQDENEFKRLADMHDQFMKAGVNVHDLHNEDDAEPTGKVREDI